MTRPFCQLKLVQNQDLLDRLRELPERSQRNIRRLIVTELVPYLEQRANELMSADSPMPVSSPFAFGTDASRKFYFAMIHSNPELTDGSHWLRTFRIEQGWQFEASDRLRGVQIRGRNAIPEATYVFGPYLVEGHRRTGWPEKAEEMRLQLNLEMKGYIARLWRMAVRDALDGKG